MGEQNDMAPSVFCSFITFPSKMTDKNANDNEGGKETRKTRQRMGRVKLGEKSILLVQNWLFVSLN